MRGFLQRGNSIAHRLCGRSIFGGPKEEGMKSVFRFSLALSVCLLLIAPVAFGQTTGEITGTVTGTDGRPLPGVTVEATSPSLQGTRVSVTGNDGTFRFI